MPKMQIKTDVDTLTINCKIYVCDKQFKYAFINQIMIQTLPHFVSFISSTLC